MRILLVDADARTAESVAADLRRRRHVVDIAGDGRDGLAFAESGVHDLILLELALPDIDGISICRRLSEERRHAMIVIATACNRVDKKIHAFDAGADDYVVKPIDPDELAARIRAIARRSHGCSPLVFNYGQLLIDLQRSCASYADRPLTLTRTEFAILETFLRNSQQLFTRDTLQQKVTTFASDAGPQSIKTHIANLRRKLRAAGCANDPIENVYGVGYRLAETLIHF